MRSRLARRLLRIVSLSAVCGTLLASAVIPAADASVTVGSTVGSQVGRYDYSPAVIQTGTVQQFWWCGQGATSDNIFYKSIDTSTGAVSATTSVLAPTAGAWDSAFVCNAAVVKGTFTNPLGNGTTYGYAMYYVATDVGAGTYNRIGVAFSNNGTAWAKYPNPIFTPSSSAGYGAGEPSPYNANGGSNITLFFEYNGHQKATSTDGVHFGATTALTTNGLLAGTSTWGDIGYDSSTGVWYAVYNNDLRAPSTTGGVTERGQLGYTLYRISNANLTTGTWQELTTVDTNLTGYEANFIPGLLRDGYGNVNIGTNPNVEMYGSTSVPRPAANSTPAQAGASGDTATWDILWSVWTPGQPLRALTRYYSPSTKLGTHEVTTGWVDTGQFAKENSLGNLYEAPSGAASKPLYGCKAGSLDYFISPSASCEGQRVLGLEGYAYASQTDASQIPLYRCYTGTTHFVSPAAGCEGQHTDELLGYAHA